MILTKSLEKFGDYVMLMTRVFSAPDRWSEFSDVILLKYINWVLTQLLL